MLPLDTLSPCAYTYDLCIYIWTDWLAFFSCFDRRKKELFLFSFPRQRLPACSSPQYASSMSMRTRPGVVFRAPASLAWDCVWCPMRCCRKRTDDVPVSKPRINPCSDWLDNRRKNHFCKAAWFHNSLSHSIPDNNKPPVMFKLRHFTLALTAVQIHEICQSHAFCCGLHLLLTAPFKDQSGCRFLRHSDWLKVRRYSGKVILRNDCYPAGRIL